MLKDLRDENIQPKEIDPEIPEIVFSDNMRTRLTHLFIGSSFIRINKSSSIVKTGTQYVFFSNQWFYLATLCKDYALAVYEYCKFYDTKIRQNEEIVKALSIKDYEFNKYVALFDDDDESRKRMTLFLSDKNYRPGKDAINIYENTITARSDSDIFGSCMLSRLAVPNASSAYLGQIIYLLAGSPDIYNELEIEINRIIAGESIIESNIEPSLQSSVAKGGFNKIFYGAPGCGKSHYIKEWLHSAGVPDNNIIRVTFHPEYSNVDFIGQILPTIETDSRNEDIVKYKFSPGAFSLALEKAYNTNDMIYLVIEEINRGNAAAIFGEMFQLLDREQNRLKPTFNESEYPVSNPNLQKYLITRVKREELKVKLEKGIYIPSNLTIIATMNSSDQNVFTLDTAFKRRWKFEQLSNDIGNDSNHPYKRWYIPGTSVTWEKFLSSLNDTILSYRMDYQTNEDKRLGKYFVTPDCLTETIKNIEDAQEEALGFAFKVLEYLWNDVCKMGGEDLFDKGTYRTLEQLIEAFVAPKEGETPLSVFKDITF